MLSDAEFQYVYTLPRKRIQAGLEQYFTSCFEKQTPIMLFKVHKIWQVDSQKKKIIKLLLIPVLGSQHAGDMCHKPGGRLPLLSARLAVTLVTFKRAGTNFPAW